MWMRARIAGVIAVAMLATALAVPAAAQKKVPYWASIAAGKARMRTGPGRQFPASWLYQRAGLPVKVLETYPNWRKIEDPDGVIGWIQGNLLDEQRTAIVSGGVATMHAKPNPTASIVWRAEPGVVGKLSQCNLAWCLFDVKGRSGYVPTSSLWGVATDERLP